jgi:Gene product 88
MNVREAKELTGGGLGYPSKMPGTSYGISAHNCITGAKLAKIEGSVCHGCYALRANYNYQSVKTAHQRRQESIAGPSWSAAMAFLINRSGDAYHRWHDSGDLQSTEHLTKICAVAAMTSNVQHWLPTREHGIVAQYVAQGGVVPDNLLIRVSATMIDGPATKAWAYTSGVHTKATKDLNVCPAPTQGNKCGECRSCWSRDVAHVSYHKH